MLKISASESVPGGATSPLPGNVLGVQILKSHLKPKASQVAVGVKNMPANAGDMRDLGLIPGWGRSPGGGQGNPLQYSCLENPMDRGVCQVTVHRVAQSQIQLKQINTHLKPTESETTDMGPSPLQVNLMHAKA